MPVLLTDTVTGAAVPRSLPLLGETTRFTDARDNRVDYGLMMFGSNADENIYLGEESSAMRLRNEMQRGSDGVAGAP